MSSDLKLAGSPPRARVTLTVFSKDGRSELERDWLLPSSFTPDSGVVTVLDWDGNIFDQALFTFAPRKPEPNSQSLSSPNSSTS